MIIYVVVRKTLYSTDVFGIFSNQNNARIAIEEDIANSRGICDWNNYIIQEETIDQPFSVGVFADE